MKSKLFESKGLEENEDEDSGSELGHILIDYKTCLRDQALYEVFIEGLVSYDFKQDKKKFQPFKYAPEHIIALTKACLEIISDQPIIIRTNSPVKVFGDIHGQFEDLHRFFRFFGFPTLEGDIEATDYLFLGDYVDRGVRSLEVICLLMALKLKFPTKILLIRGNHEDKVVNTYFGFKDECSQRLPTTNGMDVAVFNCINELFEMLPLAAIINDEIFCVHGGVGAHLKYISDIEKIKRPLVIEHEALQNNDKVVMDILWSDPTDSDDIVGIQPNLARDASGGQYIVKFGPDLVEEFLYANKLNLIIRAHECVMDGVERFAGGKVLTVFSATNYCRRYKNAGGMLLIKSNCEIIPYLIYPLTQEKDTWIDSEEDLEKRPPTPPRMKFNAE